MCMQGFIMSAVNSDNVKDSATMKLSSSIRIHKHVTHVSLIYPTYRNLRDYTQD